MPSPARSLHKPQAETAALRRVVAGVIADNGVPGATASDTAICLNNYESVDCIATCPVAGGSFDVQVFWWYEVAQLFVFDDNIGTVAVTNAGGPEAFPIMGTSSANQVSADSVFIRVFNFVGANASASVWLSARNRTI